MEELWTPWRMRYILGHRTEQGCIFCLKAQDSSHHQFVLARGQTTFTVLNLYPYTVGHLMVIPYRHLARMSEMSDEERDEMARSLGRAEGILRRVAGAQWFHAGINLGRAAGAGVEGHLHTHLVPRATSNEWRLGPAGPEGLPVSCEETYARLLPHFSQAALS